MGDSRFLDAAEDAQGEIDVPWDELRAARVHKKALAAFKAARDDGELEGVPSPEDAPSGEDEPSLKEVEREDASARRPRRGWVGMVAALVAVAAMFAFYWQSRGSSQGGSDETAFVASTLHYRDGSRSLMSAKAQVHVLSDTESLVAVQQKAGKVRYDITKRPERNFVVNVEGVKITVLGTVFDVQIQDGQVAVHVERGRVRVETAGRRIELTAGERATVKTAASDDETSTHAHTDERVDPDEKGEPDEPEVPGDSAAPKASASSSATAVAPSAVASAEAAPTAAEWMRRADAARASGDHEGALTALRSLIAAYPRDARATLALYTIGRVERSRGRHADAARAFTQCGAALNGDAYAAAAGAWQAAGQGGQARAAAQRYLAAFPDGVHADAMRAVAGEPGE